MHLWHGNDFTPLVRRGIPAHAQLVWQQAGSGRPVRPYVSGLRPGDEVVVYDRTGRAVHTVVITTDDLDRGYAVAKRYRTLRYGGGIPHPIFLVPRSRSQAGDGLNLSRSEW